MKTTYCNKIFLKPGELVASPEPMIVTTVLGSCTSITMYHPKTHLAAICHCMLPKGGDSESFKYVDTSVSYMANYFKQMSITWNEVEVKLFGGADMFGNSEKKMNNITVGWQNIIASNRCLKECGLVVIASDVGGRVGRKMIFKTDTGDVFVKKATENDKIFVS